MPARRVVPILLLATFLVVALAPTAAAHASANSGDGKVRVTWGFLDEPAFTGAKLRLDIILRDPATGAGIGGVSAADITELSLHYGEEEYDLGNLTAYRGVKGSAFAGDGNYTGAKAVWLTRAGIYTLHIQGTIHGSEVDLEIPSTHEYPSHDEIAFPEAQAEALEARVAALEGDLQALKQQMATQANAPATVTPQDTSEAPAAGLLLALLALAAVALLLRRK